MQDHTTEPKKDSDEPSKRRMIFDLFLHEDDRISQRTDWFLISHAILFEAFISVSNERHRLALGLFGLVVGWLWLMNGMRQQWSSKQLGDCVESPSVMGLEISHEFKHLFERRRKSISQLYQWASAVPTFTVTIPLACVIAWVVLLDIPQSIVKFYDWTWVSAALAITAASILTFLVGRRLFGVFKKHHAAD
ncbi:MAG: hypothetical protein A3J24_11510 [Deltaproteobacteria bacterium RIFCSPLOWO2_02_FULL_53_8]|nr:MAG: hypothetical protein A3J24_11510 [Deltaproteobacteria bacterium RIFCSPLOWO2_02_FULL_53_8]